MFQSLQRPGKLCFFALPVLLILAVFQATTFAQTETGQISGKVTDPTGAVVAGASVTIKSPSTGLTRSVTTSGEGLYNVTNLQPGICDVKVNGRPAYAIEYKRDKKSGTYRLFFDTESFRWVRTEFGRVTISKQIGAFTNDVESKSDENPTVDFYVETADFREVDGLRLPFKMTQVVTFPLVRQKLVGTLNCTITEYKQNVEIDQKMFQ
jgi:hypothetical protein